MGWLGDLMSLKGTFDGKTVLVTGHTGFKGSWLALWLRELGAQVIGYSLEPPTSPGLFELCHLSDRLIDVRGDVRDLPHLEQTIRQYRPQVVLHLAAQPLVRLSYHRPQETFEINVGGTVNLLEAVRRTDTTLSVVCITTDKVYKNREWLWGYRENDELGGHDPYSASKAMAELAIESYRQSFFGSESLPGVASARAGNVIGGGDWAADRLLPDLVRALVQDRSLTLRNPNSVRPWQHVLESLSGYLWLADRLLQADGRQFAEAWNFGPDEQRGVSTQQVIEKAIAVWGQDAQPVRFEKSDRFHHETALLRLNCDKTAHRLGWRAVYDWEQAVSETMRWYKIWFERQSSSSDLDMYDVCVSQIQAYTKAARAQGLAWAQ